MTSFLHRTVLILVLPLVIVEPVATELRKAWRRLNVRGEMAKHLRLWRSYWEMS